MSWLARAAIFALKELASPVLDELGKKVGSAFGERIGRRVDPEGARLERERMEKRDRDSEDGDEGDDIDEDERTS